MLLTRRLLNQVFLVVQLKSFLRTFYGSHHDMVYCYRQSVSQVSIRFCHHSWFIAVSVTRVTRRGTHVVQELLKLSWHPSSPRGFSGYLLLDILVFCVELCKSLFVLWSFLHWPLHCLAFFDLRLLVPP